MGAAQQFISYIVDLIIQSMSLSTFAGSLLFVPFILWLIRQVIVYFKLIVWSLFK